MENLKSYSELFEAKKVNEAKGIHPAIKSKLEKFIKNNPNCTFKDAERHIAKAMKGWKLSKEDFDECLAICNGSKEDKKESKEDTKQAFFDSKKKEKK